MTFNKALIALSLGFALAACSQNQPTNKEVQAEKALAAAQSISFTENAEIENIKRRLELTANPGLIGYIVLLNEMGQPVMYTGVKGKVTSGSKRLTHPQGWNGEMRGWAEAPSDEGTYGSSNPYVYFWTTEGQYIQWDGGYLYSDKPIRLSQAPLVIATTEAK